MAGQSGKAGISPMEAELIIEKSAGSSGMVVVLQGVLVGTAPRVGEKIEVEEGKFKVVEVSHRFSVTPMKHVVVVTVEERQSTTFQ